MKKNTGVLGGFALGFILLGVGCQAIPAPQETQENPSVINAFSDEKESFMQKKEALPNDIALQAEALGNGEVKFTWAAPEGLTEANRFILVQGTEENPLHDGKHNWFRQYYTNRAVIWRQLSRGQHHFRICLTENETQDTCVRYSNDVLVNVK